MISVEIEWDHMLFEIVLRSKMRFISLLVQGYFWRPQLADFPVDPLSNDTVDFHAGEIVDPSRWYSLPWNAQLYQFRLFWTGYAGFEPVVLSLTLHEDTAASRNNHEPGTAAISLPVSGRLVKISVPEEYTSLSL